MEIKSPQLPFLTRDMLRYGSKSSLQIRVTSFSEAGMGLTLRGITKDDSFIFQTTQENTGGPEDFDFNISDIPISLSVTHRTGTTPWRSAFVIVSLLINGDIVNEFCSGYVDRMKGLSFPLSNSQSPNPLDVQLRILESADPAAGGSAFLQTDTNSLVKVIAFKIQLVTDANTANRRVFYNVSDAIGNIMHGFCDIDQVASTTRNYFFAPYGNLPDRENDTKILVPIPTDFWLPTEETIEIGATNIQVGDNFGKIELYGFQYWGSYA